MPKISHSSWKKYLTCPYSHKLHYADRLRPKGNTMPLAYGIAMDEALNNYLLGKGNVMTKFRNTFNEQIDDNTIIDFKDIDIDIVGEEHKALRTRLRFKGFNNLDKLDKKLVQMLAKKSLTFVGEISLRGYRDMVFPLIEEVYFVQQDTPDRPGVMDVGMKLKGYGKCLIDHKTAGDIYKDDQVLWDTQLALYAGQSDLPNAGFIVMSKKLDRTKVKVCSKCDNKFSTSHATCPKLNEKVRCHGDYEETIKFSPVIQIIVDKIPKSNIELVNESITKVETLIEKKHYPKNLGACSKIYGKPCVYLNYCWKNSKANLTKQEKK